ncbi:acyltransferase family protein [Capnocytophaga sp. ARDL2]|uniref:acyltransferase family protein n=1 Tax=Capnocytophaga sp. ARDL2 TaxID=3238809 RepID=UPI003556652B
MTKENNLQFLRLLLAFMVFVTHFIELSGFTSLTFARNFHYAIYAFFVVSGMLIYASVEKNDKKTYFKNRFLRIYPAYAFVILFFSVLLFFVSKLTLKEYFSNEYLSYLVNNLSFLNFLKPCIHDVFALNPDNCAVNGSLWTIKIEVMFYIFVPVLFFLIKNKSRITANICLASLYLMSFIYFYYFNEIQQNNLYAKQFPGVLTYFVSGILLYKNFHYFKRNIIWFIFPALFFLQYKTSLLFPFSIAMIVFFVAFKLPYFSKLDFKNDYSYGLYLVHYPIIQTIASFDFQNENPIFYNVIVVVLACLFSYFLWHFIEKPVLKLR